MTTTIDLLRHGEPEGGPKYRGSLDDPLSAAGWQQMRAAVRGHPAWETIYSSPLQRCARFADELGQQLAIPVVRERRFQEMDFGHWEGRTSTDILATDYQGLTQFWRDPLNNPPPGGEHLATFQQRVQEGWQALVSLHRDQSLLVVAHSGVIRMILSLVLQVPLQNLSRMVVEYASVSRVRVDEVAGQPLPRLIFHAGRFD
ncbi:MAG: alpha-ribazole phosphatase family protein [Magnetococcales bacterium]|nr:alpha-ribazole phosphatase family protein [Magnetococcales bacterium]